MPLKRVVVAIIAILVAIGLSGCTSDYRVPYDDLEMRCEKMEEALGDISWLVDEARSALADMSEGSTTAWSILTGHSDFNEETLWDAICDIEDSWNDENDLRDILNDIESIVDDAKE